MYVGIDEYPESPPERECHEEKSTIVCDESEHMIVLEESHHREEIAPVMSLFTHTTDEGKCTSTGIWDIECNVCQVLTEPPESYARCIWVMFPKEEYIDDDTWYDDLHEAPTEYGKEVTERHKYNMSRLMEYQIGQMYPGIHHSSIDIECVELEWVEGDTYPEYESQERELCISSNRQEEWVHR